MNKQLTWHEEVGEDDERIWEAPSIYHNEGDHFMFRIAETAAGFVETSDFELRLQAPRTWETLQSAKDTLLGEHLAMITAERASVF